MIGLNYIRKDIFDMSANWLAHVIGITRQSVMDWEAKRSTLLDYRLEELEKIFGVSKKWYNKEIEEIDKLKINNEVLNNIITGKFFETKVFSKNIRYKSVINLDNIIRITDISERNRYILQQITENENLIKLIEITNEINVLANNFMQDTTLYGLYLNCLSTFANTINNIIQEPKENQDIEIANLKKYLLNYKNNDI